jgi:SAM-dependent methyltransferase
LDFVESLRRIGTFEPLGRAGWDSLTRSPEGIPLLLDDPPAYVAAMGPDWAADLERLSPDGLHHLARYMPQLSAPDAPLRRVIRDLLGTQVPSNVPLALELGCSVGPDLRALAAVADEVVGIDAYMPPLRAAWRSLRGEEPVIPVCTEGHTFHFQPGRTHPPATDTVSLICGNALDPPFLAETVDLVLAINLLDNVCSPVDLIGQMDAILKPGGLMILASPFHWNDTITPVGSRLGGGSCPAFEGMTSPEVLRLLLQGETPFHAHLNHQILDEVQVPWTLIEHTRCRLTYDVHVLVTRKQA